MLDATKGVNYSLSLILNNLLFDIAGSYCNAPCVPFGATTLHKPRYYGMGATVEFNCEDKEPFSGSTKRICMKNKRWSGTELDCTGRLCFYLSEVI